MQTNKQIKQKEQMVARLERKLALQKIKQRKAETRRKIELGGLVAKANMDRYPKDVILGALIHAKQQMEKESGAKILYRSIGQSAFMEFEPS